MKRPTTHGNTHGNTHSAPGALTPVRAALNWRAAPLLPALIALAVIAPTGTSSGTDMGTGTGNWVGPLASGIGIAGIIATITWFTIRATRNINPTQQRTTPGHPDPTTRKTATRKAKATPGTSATTTTHATDPISPRTFTPLALNPAAFPPQPALRAPHVVSVAYIDGTRRYFTAERIGACDTCGPTTLEREITHEEDLLLPRVTEANNTSASHERELVCGRCGYPPTAAIP